MEVLNCMKGINEKHVHNNKRETKLFLDLNLVEPTYPRNDLSCVSINTCYVDRLEVEQTPYFVINFKLRYSSSTVMNYYEINR